MKIKLFAGLLAGLLAKGALAQVPFSVFYPGPSGPVKSNGTYALQSEVSADIIGLWTGTCNATTFLKGAGACGQVVLTTDVSGILPVPSGGLGVGTITGLVLGNGTSPVSAYGGNGCTNQFVRSLSSAGVATCNSVSLTTDVTGQLTVPGGGTGVGTLTGLVLGNGTSAMSAYGGSNCTNQFVRSLSSVGAATCNSVSLTSDVTNTLGPTNGGTGLATFTLGDLLYSNAANSLAKLAGNTTSTKQFLTQTGTGTVSAAPAWGAIASGDLPFTSGSGSFTYASGCSAGTPTATYNYVKLGSIVWLFIQGTGTTCTSTAFTITFSGMPAAIQPPTTAVDPVGDCVVNNFPAACHIAVNSGTSFFDLSPLNATGQFSGTHNGYGGAMFTYILL